MSLSIRTARKADYPQIQEFLAQREEYWTSLTARLNIRGRIKPPGDRDKLWLFYNGEELHGLIYNGVDGYTIPAVPAEHMKELSDALFTVARNLPKLRTLLGHAGLVDRVIEAREKAPEYRVDYLLMAHREESTQRISPPSGIRIEKARPKMARELYQLQKAYEIEEVLLEPKRFNPLICMSHLRDTLENQTVFYASSASRPVAKAGTNALGFGWAQIGGVFTEESFRGRGIARSLMSELLTYLAARKLKASLFVKPDNPAAVALYRRLGFEELGPFSIAYYLR